MALKNLTIVIPTKGRITLYRCLDSIHYLNQEGYKAEVLVVHDTYDYYDTDVKKLAKHFGFTYIEHDEETHNWGYPQLQVGYSHAQGDYIMNIGDDDVYLPNALNVVREEVSKTFMPYLFQVVLHPSLNRGNEEPVMLWNKADREFKRQKVTGQNFICPNVKDKIGFWWDDFCQMEATVNKWGGNVQWIEKIIANCF